MSQSTADIDVCTPSPAVDIIKNSIVPQTQGTGIKVNCPNIPTGKVLLLILQK